MNIPIISPALRALRRLFDWALSLADKKWAEPALYGLTFAEASFLPIPVDPLLMAMGASKPERAIRYGLLTTLFSVAGGVFGWLIGAFMMDLIGNHIVEMWGIEQHWSEVEALYQEHGNLILFAAALTPLPFIAFTIVGGAVGQSLPTFVAIALIGRGLRFVTEGVLLRVWGAPIVAWVEKWFDRLAIVFTILLVVTIYLLKYR